MAEQMLSPEFIALLKESVGAERASTVVGHLEDEPQVSVRINPQKIDIQSARQHFAKAASCEEVPWCEQGLYLTPRPSFTADPLFHAGAYYVQEASSMYIARLAANAFESMHCEQGVRVLDLCAAPGGKSTHLLSLLSDKDLLVCNEVMRMRATTLADNIARWGRPNVVVTNDDPASFKRLEGYFDLMLTDVPCSGEGMFRKDEEAVEEWSPDNVKLCASRQRRILADAWCALRDGGYLIYSTCTFNHFEDEDNARWICSELGAELLEERHFLPGIDRGEGFYCALLRKNGDSSSIRPRVGKIQPLATPANQWIADGNIILAKGDLLKAYPAVLAGEMREIEQRLHVIQSGVAVAAVKGKDLIPEADLAISTILRREAFPEGEIERREALRFLAREAILLPEAPKGFVLVTHDGFPLGFVKNLGNRTNNLYPISRRIRNANLI